MLSLDGLGLSMMERLAPSMPTLSKLLHNGAIASLLCPLPLEGQVAWASFATGQNPGKHGVFGLVDRVENPFSTFITSSQELKSPTIWEILSRHNKFMGVMNVPLSYPPLPVNGFMVGCSLTPELDLAQATYPVDMAPRLLELDYRIEANNMLALEDPEAFLADLIAVMRNRFNAARQLMQSEPWDYWQLHDLTFDRLHRFFYIQENQDQALASACEMVYKKIDTCLVELLSHLPAECQLIIASTHGFSKCRATFMLNYWLEQNGYLLFSQNRKSIENIHQNTRAYSLAPGRIYINLQGREEMGSVPRGQAYEELCDELIHRLQGLSLPNSQEPVFNAIYKREQLYAGPETKHAPDLIAQPGPGFDLRANMNAQALWQEPMQAGLPLPADGFIYVNGMQTISTDAMSIMDLAPTALNLLGIEIAPDMDGQNRL